MNFIHQLIFLFSHHKVAANLLMLAIFFLGFFGMKKVNVQFMPTFKIYTITVNVPWRDASPEDVETSLIIPIENELRGIEELDELKSTARIGNAGFRLKFDEGTNMNDAQDKVEQAIARVKTLPADSEKPIVQIIESFELVASIGVFGTKSLSDLAPIAYAMKDDLLDAGLSKVQFKGIPGKEISIEVPLENLVKLNMSIDAIANQIRANSQDITSGIVDRADSRKILKTISKRRNINEILNLAIKVTSDGQIIRIKDIAEVKERYLDDSLTVTTNGMPIIELSVYRAEKDNSLDAADALNKVVKKYIKKYDQTFQFQLYNESYKLLEDRISVLVKNGLYGFILIILILLIFFRAHVSFWIAAGIPISFAAAMFLVYLFGSTINMVSLFAFIMALGIIVDDTLVVSEESLTQAQLKLPLINVVNRSARKMLSPIFAASTTTILGFLPLFLIGDVIGQIVKAIPLVIVFVIIASLIECFFILPSHLYHSLRRYKHTTASNIFSRRFDHIKEQWFMPSIRHAVKRPYLTVLLSYSFILLPIICIKFGVIKFNFFPSPEGQNIYAACQFATNINDEKKKNALEKIIHALKQADKEINEEKSIISVVTEYDNAFIADPREADASGHTYATVAVELTSPEDRYITSTEFISKWKEKIGYISGLERLDLSTPQAGPPGKDVDVELKGYDIHLMKKYALEIQDELQKMEGVYNIADNLPFNQEQLRYTLLDRGRALNLSVNDLSKQLNAAFIGSLVDIIYEPNEEIDIRVKLPDNERDNISTLDIFPIIHKDTYTLLTNLASFNSVMSPQLLRHNNGKLGLNVFAAIDPAITNTTEVVNRLTKILPTIVEDDDVQYRFTGKAEEQAKTFADIVSGMLLAVVLIYITLAWVFSSYGLPFIILITIPLGLSGAILGHALIGIDLTILSIFAFFGLVGIMVNDSIILVNEYRHHEKLMASKDLAVIKASESRFRAILLTSSTTIVGLAPLMFERSLQAQFLIPMATSIAFGLAFATIFILYFTPCTIKIYNQWKEQFRGSNRKQIRHSHPS